METMNSLTTEMRNTAATLLEALRAFDYDEFNEVPFEGSWTAGQVADHLLKAADVTQVLHGRTAPTWRNPGEKVEMLRHVFLDFKTKFKTPDFIVPSDGPHSQAEMDTALTEVWAGLDAATRKLDLTQTCLDFELPVFGLLTRTEWICFYMVHTQRHIHQLIRMQEAMSKRPISQ